MRRNSGIEMESTKKNRIKMSYDRTDKQPIRMILPS